MRGVERGLREKTRQSRMLDEARLVGIYSLIKGSHKCHEKESKGQ